MLANFPNRVPPWKMTRSALSRACRGADTPRPVGRTRSCDLRGAPRHLPLARRVGARVPGHVGECHAYLRSKFRQHAALRGRQLPARGPSQRARGFYRDSRPAVRPEEVPTLARLVATREVMHVEDLAVESPHERIAVLGGARTPLIVPLMKEDELIGAIGFIAGSCVRLPPSRSNWSQISPSRLSSLLRTPGCSMSCAKSLQQQTAPPKCSVSLASVGRSRSRLRNHSRQRHAHLRGQVCHYVSV